MKSKTFIHLDIEDVAHYAHFPQTGKHDLLVIDDFRNIPIDDKSLQTSFFTIALCHGGSGEFVLNDRPFRIREGDLMVMLGQQIISPITRTDDFHLVGVLQSRAFVQDTLHSMLHLWPYLLFLIDHPVVHLTVEEREEVEQDYSRLVRCLKRQDHTFRTETVRTLLQLFYFDICHFLESRCPRHETSKSRPHHIFYQFMENLYQYYIQEREVSWYADQLNLTAKYLSEAVKAVSGRTASQWISAMVVMEIKNLLRGTAKSVKEIAVDLNFPNQSFLGKYFKNITGMSPVEFRNRG